MSAVVDQMLAFAAQGIPLGCAALVLLALARRLRRRYGARWLCRLWLALAVLFCAAAAPGIARSACRPRDAARRLGGGRAGGDPAAAAAGRGRALRIARSPAGGAAGRCPAASPCGGRRAGTGPRGPTAGRGRLVPARRRCPGWKCWPPCGWPARPRWRCGRGLPICFGGGVRWGGRSRQGRAGSRRWMTPKPPCRCAAGPVCWPAPRWRGPVTAGILRPVLLVPQAGPAPRGRPP